MTDPAFTVLIDTFNYGRFIEQAVNSVLKQDFPLDRIEILVIDDGSTDDTEERVTRFGGTVRYIKKTNGGQASAFNLGMRQARGEFVALLDADDVWMPHKLSRIYQAFVEHPDAGMIYHRLYQWLDDGKGESETLNPDHFIAISGRVPDSRFLLLCYPMVGTSGLSFRRRALLELLPIPELLRTQADAYLTALIIFVCPVIALDEYLTKYRIHGSNLFYGQKVDHVDGHVRDRIAVREALILSIREWMCKRGVDVETKRIRDYLKQWTKAQEVDIYSLQPPGRMEYFNHLREYPTLYRDLMTGRQIAYNHLRSFAALLLGYRRMYYFDQLYARYKKRSWGTREQISTKVRGNQ